MVERGVRFVQIYSGGMENERGAGTVTADIVKNHGGFAGRDRSRRSPRCADRSANSADCWKRRWSSGAANSGGLPIVQKGGTGRDHNPHAFTYWLAGGGVKGGTLFGKTDELGHRAVENRISVNDLHATFLHLLGMDHQRLTYNYNGRDFRLTDVAGKVVKDIVA